MLTSGPGKVDAASMLEAGTLDVQDFYYAPLAAACVRGTLRGTPQKIDEALCSAPLESLGEHELAILLEAGLAAGLRLHRFKRTMGLPRVARVLGVLRGLQPAGLLDIGSGRGAFLWPLLDAFPDLPVTAVDCDEHRVRMLQTVSAGGIDRLTAYQADATVLPFGPGQFDVVTALEVVEHIQDVEAAVREVVRVARRHVLVSVPSHADDNPEHLHLLGERDLERLFRAAGALRIGYQRVPNHLIAVVTKGD
jgi:2-polyprenyl-3-methyl-5-hydroxy-6-metoxy-1,4-benzoquinol methylase